jgi:citrate lyase subunit beta/citryl-CoA lyase
MFRSLLFIPGNNPSMLQNADIFPADGIIFDLEDAVSVKEKVNARNLVKHYLETSSVLPKKVILRTNDIESEYFIKDLELFKTNRIDFLLLPKISYSILPKLELILSQFENNEKTNKIKVIGLIETVKAVNEVEKIAENKRLYGLLLGAEDLASDLEIKRTDSSEEIIYPRSKVIFAAKANNLIAIDTPYTDINNPEGLLRDVKFANQLGMKAKTAIHPNQLEVINTEFSPKESDILWAKEIIKLSETNKDKGSFQYLGKMIDKPIIARAKRILENAKSYGLI